MLQEFSLVPTLLRGNAYIALTFLVPTLLRGNAYITLTVSCSHAGAWEQGEANLLSRSCAPAWECIHYADHFSFPRSCVGMHTLR